MLLQRDAIRARLSRAATYPVALLVAPSGFGKSAALGRLHRDLGPTSFLYEVAPSHTSLTRFVRGLAAALEPALPSLAQSLAIAHERAMQSGTPSEVLAGWLAQHVGGRTCSIAIDDFHHCEREPAIAAFLAGAVERTRGTVRWIIATRTLADLPFATWFARGDAELPVDEHALRATQGEAVALAAGIAPLLELDVVERLREATGGALGKLRFALATAGGDPALVRRILDAGGDAHERFADAALAALDSAERRLLTSSAFFPDLDRRLFAAAGHAEAGAKVSAVRAKLPSAFVERAGELHYSPLFADVLAKRVAAAGSAAVLEANVRAAEALEAAGRAAEAFAFYIRGRAFEALAKAIETHGFRFVEAGFGETVGEAIEALDPMVQMSSPVILALKAMFESRLGRFDTAESWFQLSLNRAALAAPDVRDAIAYEYCTHLLRFIRPEAIELLEQLVAKTDTTPERRCYAFSALGPAYVFARRFDEASRSCDAALALLPATRSPHLRARVHHQAAYVALFRGNGTQAKTLASISLAVAREHGFFDVAAGALTVLYNVASDVEDDTLESVRLLDAVADCAAKSGSLTTHLFALIARLEVEAERGDEAAIDELEQKLRTIDITCSGRAAYEALLPTQALRASWSGDFAGAYRVLAASATQQWSADRKALRWAEIAAYAAAAGLREEATSAFRNASDSLEGLEPDVRVARARLLLALAMVLLGRIDSARELFDVVDAAPHALSPRLRALRRTVGALGERYRGAANAGTLLEGLRELEEHHLGGLARMLMNLPLADNAALRLPELDAADRRILAEVAAGNILVNERRVERVVGKLGCLDLRTVLRAVHRSTAFPDAGRPHSPTQRMATT
jgi:ATP/maltotriose-dependent transcriptional regulator MalT